MPAFRPLSEMVHELWTKLERSRIALPPGLREAAAVTVALGYRLEEGEELPELVNLGALTVSMRARPVVHALRASIPRIVDETDLHSLPSEPPRLLRGAWIVEVRRPDQGDRLFGDTVCLGGYPFEGAIYLMAFDWPGAARVARWAPTWDGAELEEGIAIDTSPLVPDPGKHAEWTRDAARFAVILGLLLDAEGAPVRVREERESAPPGAAKGRASAWVTRHVTLGQSRPAPDEPPTPGGDASLEGRCAAAVAVRGHLKRQRYGPGRTRTKYIYIAGYAARRWIAPRPARVVVGA